MTSSMRGPQETRRTELAVEYVGPPPIQQLDETQRDLSSRLSEVSVANKFIREGEKNLIKINKEIRKLGHGIRASSTASVDNKHLSGELKRATNTIEIARNKLEENKKYLEDLKKKIGKFPAEMQAQNRQIIKIKGLIQKLEKEVGKQEERELKQLERDLTKITGNKLFQVLYAITRTKAVKTRDELDQVSDIRKKLDLLESRVGPHLKPRFDQLRLQVGRALMLGHGFRKEKPDISFFLSLNTNDKLHDHNIDLDDATAMRLFIAEKYPKYELGLKNEMNYEKLMEFIAKYFRKERQSKEDLPRLKEMAWALERARKGITPNTADHRQYLHLRDKLGEALLKAKGYTLPLDMTQRNQYFLQLDKQLAKLKPEHIPEFKYELLYLGKNASSDADREHFSLWLGKSLFAAYGLKNIKKMEEFLVVNAPPSSFDQVEFSHMDNYLKEFKKEMLVEENQ